MNSDDDMDSWQTAPRAPVDVSQGVIPSWLEAALPAEAAGCPLTATAAFNAIMKFFIGSPESKGIFFAQLYRPHDTFAQMRTALGAIMRVLAKKLVDPALTRPGLEKFPFPLVAFSGDINSDDEKAAFIAAAELRFIDVNDEGTGPSAWFQMLLGIGAPKLGRKCADATPPVPGLESFQTPTPAAAVAPDKATGKKTNQAQDEQILDGTLIDPARIKRLLETDPAIVSFLKTATTRLKNGADLMGIKPATADSIDDLCDWASALFFDGGVKLNDSFDRRMISYVLCMNVGPATDYATSDQPLATVLNARDQNFLDFMKNKLSHTSGPSGRILRKFWRPELMQPSVSHDKGGMSRYSLATRDLRGFEASSQRPIMLAGTCFDDLIVPADTFLRGIAFHTIRVADHRVRKPLRACMLKFYNTLVTTEHSPGTAIVLIRTRVLDRVIDALVLQLSRTQYIRSCTLPMPFSG